MPTFQRCRKKEREQMMIATSGMKLLESLPNVNRAGLLGKMLKDLLTSTTAWSSDRCKLIWKIKVSKSNVLLFQLQASVHGIKGKESGLLDSMLPTPTTMDHIDRKGMRPSRAATNRKTGYLSEMIKMYPTPTASCQMDVVAPPETVLQNSKGWTVTRKKNWNEVRSKAERCSEQDREDVPNTNSERSQRHGVSTNMETEQRQISSKNSIKEQQTWWQTQSEFCGIPNGISATLDKDRSNRIKSLGNSIVPQIARQLGLSIVEAELSG
jgi:hypothetical protein